MGDGVTLGLVVKALVYLIYKWEKRVTHSRFSKINEPLPMGEGPTVPTDTFGGWGRRSRRRAAFGPATVPDRGGVGKWLVSGRRY